MRSLSIITALLACLTLSACAGGVSVDPALEAYAESGGRPVGAIGIRLPGVDVDSEGVVVGPNVTEKTAETAKKVSGDMKAAADKTNDAAHTTRDGMSQLSTAIIVLGGVILLVGLLFLVFRRKD